MEKIEGNDNLFNQANEALSEPATDRAIRVLLIDDDPIFCRIFCHRLRLEKIECEYCTNSQMALKAVEKINPDVIFVDFNLGDPVDGASLCQWLSTLTDAAIVAISADLREETALINLKAGALNYLTKPINFRLLPPTVRSMTRYARTHRSEEDRVKRYLEGAIKIDFSANLLFLREEKYDLSPKETSIVNALLANFGRTVPKNVLFEQVYRYEYDPSSRALDIAVCRLRKKVFEKSDFKIYTLRSRGFRLDWVVPPAVSEAKGESLVPLLTDV